MYPATEARNVVSLLAERSLQARMNPLTKRLETFVRCRNRTVSARSEIERRKAQEGIVLRSVTVLAFLTCFPLFVSSFLLSTFVMFCGILNPAFKLGTKGLLLLNSHCRIVGNARLRWI